MTIDICESKGAIMLPSEHTSIVIRDVSGRAIMSIQTISCPEENNPYGEKFVVTINSKKFLYNEHVSILEPKL